MKSFLRILLFLLPNIVRSSAILPHDNTNISAIIGPTCLDTTLWSLPTFSASDCKEAVEKLANSDVTKYGREVFDFMVAGATSRTRYRKVQLPAAYDHGTCTLAIAMLATIPVRYIPPIPLGTFFPETDRSTYEIILLLAQRVQMRCIDGVGVGMAHNDQDFMVTLPGWITAGSRNAIGVFFFDSRSFMRRLVFGGLGEENWHGNGSTPGLSVKKQNVA